MTGTSEGLLRFTGKTCIYKNQNMTTLHMELQTAERDRLLCQVELSSLKEKSFFPKQTVGKMKGGRAKGRKGTTEAQQNHSPQGSEEGFNEERLRPGKRIQIQESTDTEGEV